MHDTLNKAMFRTVVSLGQIKKTVFRVTGLKILGKVGTPYLYYYYFQKKTEIPFKMHKSLIISVSKQWRS